MRFALSRLEYRLAARLASCACVLHGLFPHADDGRAPDSAGGARDSFAVCLRFRHCALSKCSARSTRRDLGHLRFALRGDLSYPVVVRCPTALELFRTQMRRALAAAELTCLRMAFGRTPAEVVPISSEEHRDAAARLKLLGVTKVLRPEEAARCAALLQGAMGVTQIAVRAPGALPGAEVRSSLITVAAWRELLKRFAS